MTTTGIVGTIVADAMVIRAGETPPVSQFIGLIVSRHTGMIHAIHDPSDDKELDDPGLLANAPDAMRMIKVERAQYDSLSSEEVASLAALVIAQG
jgi:hypothetical protein